MAQSDLNPAAINAAMFVTERFARVYGNAMDQPVVKGLRIDAVSVPERRTAVIEGARLNRQEARAGEIVDVEVTVHPYQGEARVVKIPVKLPDDLSLGTIRVLVSDGATVDRLTEPPAAQAKAESLRDTVSTLNRQHANERVYVTLLDRAAQAVVGGDALPGLPLSVANVLAPLKDAQKMQLHGESAVEAASAETEYAVAGSQVLSLTLR
jgi:hypothetical protein